jgi:hypothetical protein
MIKNIKEIAKILAEQNNGKIASISLVEGNWIVSVRSENIIDALINVPIDDVVYSSTSYTIFRFVIKEEEIPNTLRTGCNPSTTPA